MRVMVRFDFVVGALELNVRRPDLRRGNSHLFPCTLYSPSSSLAEVGRGQALLTV